MDFWTTDKKMKSVQGGFVLVYNIFDNDLLQWYAHKTLLELCIYALSAIISIIKFNTEIR